MGSEYKEQLSDYQVRHDCAENDNHLTMVIEDGVLSELHVGDALEKSWTVIGTADLRIALRKVGYDLATASAVEGEKNG